MKTTKIPWLLGILMLPFLLVFAALIAMVTIVGLTFGLTAGALAGKLTLTNGKVEAFKKKP